MIKRIQIKNFKCYGEPGADFPLKRINFIFGDNSVGKSTFLQLLRMVSNCETDAISDNFKKYVFCGEEERQIKLRITAFGRKEEKESEVAQRIGKTHDLSDLTGGRDLVVTEDEQCPVYEYVLSKGRRTPLEYIGWVSGDEYLKGNHDGIHKAGTGFAEAERLFRELRYLWIPHVMHAEAARPTRFGSMPSEKKSSLAESTDVMVSSDLIEYVGRFFEELGVPYTCIDKNNLKDDFFGVKVERKNLGAGIDGLYNTALKLYEWKTYKKSMETGNPDDVYALLALEEPESHVNERQISPLMNFIFKEARDASNGQIIIECHSELMALKLKNFVRSGWVTPDDIAVLVALRTEEGTVMREIGMDSKGNFTDRWPDGGFFSARTLIVDEFFKSRTRK